MPQMKLGWWRAENGLEIMLDKHAPNCLYAWRSSKIKALAWSDAGSAYNATSYFNLVEFIRPLDELPADLNSAVKAAEDRVRELTDHAKALQAALDSAIRMLHQAEVELVKLEKECEVNVTNAAKVGDHGQGFMPAIKKCEVKP